MYISDLKMVNYRNYIDEKIEFVNGVNIFVGNNAQGKTNLIESVYYCSRGNSFKRVKDNDIIRHNTDTATLDAQIIRADRRKLIHIELGSEKKISINEIKINTLKDMKSQFDIVYFWPDHLRIIKDGPSLRRDLIDEAIINLKPSYKNMIAVYNRLLIQRNSLIKKGKNQKYFREQLIGITKKLSDIGASIFLLRNRYIEILNDKGYNIHLDISDNTEKLILRYDNSLKIEDLNKHSKKDISDLLYDKIISSLQMDLRNGYTSIGPHRDDIDMEINGLNAKIFASQGQQRSIVLSLKLAEMEIISHYNGSSPILLLDDVFSELDKIRREKFLNMIKNTQALITTNEINLEKDEIREIDYKIFKIEEGKIK
ncbi:MAG: DNA replication/repair protein RecF [Tissierellia bacterium]|nr:DNA replication/repair protein RecF [Tissierellia bacterium]